jgi:hypothetical protein
LINGLRQRDGHAHFEQRLHQISPALGHTNGKFLHGDGFRNLNITHLLNGRAARLMGALVLFPRAAQGRERAGADAIFIA